jgi:hypothetical protein
MKAAFAAVPDRIDETVPTGVDLNGTDVGWVPGRHRGSFAAAPALGSVGEAARAARRHPPVGLTGAS